MDVDDTFAFLLGGWSVRRRITDHRAGVDGSFVGTADTTPEAGSAPAGTARRARYGESGRFRLGAYDGPARRRLDYLAQEDATVLMAFADGRPFVSCDLRAGEWHARHLCGEDSYDISFFARAPGVLDEHWRVRGPAKDYEAWTTLRRR